MTQAEVEKTLDSVRDYSTEWMLELWELTSNAKPTPELPIVRGWLMAELERRNPDGYNAWLHQKEAGDEDLRRYILG